MDVKSFSFKKKSLFLKCSSCLGFLKAPYWDPLLLVLNFTCTSSTSRGIPSSLASVDLSRVPPDVIPSSRSGHVSQVLCKSTKCCYGDLSSESTSLLLYSTLLTKQDWKTMLDIFSDGSLPPLELVVFLLWCHTWHHQHQVDQTRRSMWFWCLMKKTCWDLMKSVGPLLETNIIFHICCVFGSFYI